MKCDKRIRLENNFFPNWKPKNPPEKSLIVRKWNFKLAKRFLQAENIYRSEGSTTKQNNFLKKSRAVLKNTEGIFDHY